MAVTLIKLGGSLLSRADLAPRLTRLCDAQGDDQLLLLVGGGGAADLVRDWDRTHRLGDERSHWLAIESMRLTAKLVVSMTSRCGWAATIADVHAHWDAGRVAVLDPVSWVVHFERESDLHLPRDWDTTSDTIAAWIAYHWPVDRLVLVKSVDQPADVSTSNAVDPHFLNWAQRLARWEWINLAAESANLQAGDGGNGQ